MPSAASSAWPPPAMRLMATRPPLSWSKVAIILAMTVGAISPGRAATSMVSRSVFAATMAQVIQASQHAVCTGTRAYSRPAASAARATRSNNSMLGGIDASRSP